MDSEDFDYDFWRISEYDAEYWRLSESLSVTVAAMLAAGIDPGSIEAVYPDNPKDGYFHRRGYGNSTKDYFHSSQFIAVFSAFRNAILEEKLRANITRLARGASYAWFGGEAIAEGPREDETELSYTALVRTDRTSLRTNAGTDLWDRYGKILVIKEPDWNQTSILVDDLKEWMLLRNFQPWFFFPEVKPEGFKDKEHERYSAKLAAAVSAWEAVQQPAPSRTVKQTLEKWLNENAAKFGLIDDDGRPLSTVVQTLSEVANWETRGGAPKTGSSKEDLLRKEPKPISNYEIVAPSFRPPDDTEIPF
jgi:hypothetical protein